MDLFFWCRINQFCDLLEFEHARSSFSKSKSTWQSVSFPYLELLHLIPLLGKANQRSKHCWLCILNIHVVHLWRFHTTCNGYVTFVLIALACAQCFDSSIGILCIVRKEQTNIHSFISLIESSGNSTS
jgi:hypothetical protein